MYCKKCGNKLESNDKFCTKCGNSNLVVSNNKSGSNDNDVVGVIMGVISIVLFFLPFISIPLAIVGIINGKKNRCGNRNGIGFVLGIIGLVLSIIWVVAIIGIVFFTFFVFKEEVDNFNNSDYYDEFYDYDDYDNEVNDVDEIVGYSWKVNDGGMLYLYDNMSYVWYLDDNFHDDNYYSGTYKIYNGYDAIKYIVSDLKEFGITEEEQRSMFKWGLNYIDDYYLIVFNCTGIYTNGKTDNTKLGIIPYYGFYDEDKKNLDMVDMKSGDRVGFTVNKKISGSSDNSF